MRIEIEIDTVADRSLARLEARLRDMRQPMREIAGRLQRSVERSFERQTPPGQAAAWPALRPATIHRRARRRTWPGQILDDSGQLVRSIGSDSGPDYAIAGVQRRSDTGTANIGAVHQFGRRDGTIPARPFLGRSDALDREVLDVVEDWLQQPLQP